MAIVPRKHVERISFFETRLPVWTAQALNIGTSAASVSDLETKTEAAREKFQAQQTALEAARAATLELELAVDAMSVAGAAIIKQVRAKADIAGEGIFAIANLPAPATPSPVGPPGTPFAFKVQLNPADGSLTLTWKCSNPAGGCGTIYQVQRRTGSGAYAPVGATGQKKFDDATVPAGAASVSYRIQAIRSTQQGAAAEFTVNFGVGGGGEMTASVAAAAGAAGGGESPKLAA